MTNHVTHARIGLTYLENAVLEALADSQLMPGQLARKLDLYYDFQVGDNRAGSRVVRAVLEALQREGRVERLHRSATYWKLTDKERELRRY